MKIYVVYKGYEYEGGTLLAAFLDEELARDFKRSQITEFEKISGPYNPKHSSTIFDYYEMELGKDHSDDSFWI